MPLSFTDFLLSMIILSVLVLITFYLGRRHVWYGVIFSISVLAFLIIANLT